MELAFGYFILIFLFIFFPAIVISAAKRKKPARAALTVENASVVAKRTMQHQGVNYPYFTYFITFEIENKSRLEFEIPVREFEMLHERDAGQLAFQGPKYIGFQRTGVSHAQSVQNIPYNAKKTCPYCSSVAKIGATECKNCGAEL